MIYDNNDELSPFDTTIHIFCKRCEIFVFKIKQMVDSRQKTFDEIDEFFNNEVKELNITLSRFQNWEFFTCECIFRICFDLAFNIMHNR